MSKRRIWIFALLALTLVLSVSALFTACRDDGYGPDEPSVSLSEPKDVISDYAKDTTDYASLTMQKTTVVRLHYRRNDDSADNRLVYKPWNIWAWDMTNGGNGAAYEFTHYDSYGVFVDLDLSVIGDGKEVKQMGFIVRTDTWSKDPDGDRSIEIEPETPGGIQNVYVKSADSTIFDSPTNALKSTVDCAILINFREVKVYFKPLSNTFKAYPKRFNVLVNGEENKDFTLAEYDESKKVATLNFKKDLDISDKLELSYKFDSEWVNVVTIMITSYFDTEEFKNNYSYTGNDLGATFDNEQNPTKTIFKVWAPTSKKMTLKIYATGNYDSDTTPISTYEMTKGEKGIFEYTVPSDLDGKYYTYEVTNAKGTNEVVDPYAKSAGVNGRRGMIVNFTKLNATIAGWKDDTRPVFGNNAVDASIYEIHVRDMTINPNSGVTESKRGTFAGLAEKNTSFTKNGKTVTTGLAHIAELGVTHVQIQPFYDYSSVDETNVPRTMSKTNYNWGYDPQNYNVLEGSYSTDPRDGYVRIREFKQMVMAFHQEGININMDVVYNHTASTENSNFNLLVPYYYYRTFSSGRFYNGSGCGNEMASDRFMVNKFVRESCKFWIDEYHLSGFRFDLMGLLDNQTMIDVFNDCKAIYPQIMVYGEPWTGGTSKLKGGTSSTNLSGQMTNQESLAQDYFSGANVLVGAFNDIIRNAVRGDNSPGTGYVQGNAVSTASVITLGIRGIFSQGTVKAKGINPNQVINYVSCHDNYTLNDQLVESLKVHNVNDAYTQAESLVFLSQGVPFLQEGEDFRRSKLKEDGVTFEHNSYNTGDFENNMDYSLKIDNEQVFNKFKELIALRKNNAEFRLPSRSEIDARLTNLTNVKDLISYDIDDLKVIHTYSPATYTLDGQYEIIYSNVRTSYGIVSGEISLAKNESIVLRKVA